MLAIAVAFLLLYRVQLPYPYPLLRLLPAADGVLATLLALRYGPQLARRAPALLDGLALGGMSGWLALLLIQAQQHVTLSVPGAEKDFRVFALRSAQLAARFPEGTGNPALDGVFRADGFYNLGYPLLLWLARPFASDNPFLAARLVAASSAALLLLAGWWLARQLLGRAGGLLALLLLALSPLVIEYGLYVGTDMPFAALCALALALLVRGQESEVRGQETGGQETDTQQTRHHSGLQTPTSVPSVFSVVFSNTSIRYLLAGLAAGAAFLVRHPGLLLLPFGWLMIIAVKTQNAKRKTQNAKLILVFTLAFLVAILPQLIVNMRDTDQPLFNQQAKNVWQGVFGAGDWGRWADTANSVTIGQVVAQDPARFLINWWANVRGYFGSGGEDTREFGQAVQLRLLGFPANWLAVAGLLGWLALPIWKRQKAPVDLSSVSRLMLVGWIGLYVLLVSIGLAPQARFFLPVASIYATAAAWVVQQTTRSTQHPTRYSLLAGIALLLVLAGGFVIGARYVLHSRPMNEAALAHAENRAEVPGQPADELQIITIAQTTLKPGERLAICVDKDVPIGKYSAIAHLAIAAPTCQDAAALRASGARYLIWDAGFGAAPAVGQLAATAGRYSLYRIAP